MLRWLRRAGLLVLAVGTLAGPGAAFMLERKQNTHADLSATATRPLTPVLSVRRAPTVLAGPVADRRLRRELATWMETSPDQSCLLVVDEDGEPYIDRQPDEAPVPASTIKLLTGAAALLGLGPDLRLRTSAMATDEVVDGVLRGDLWLLGGGDPLLATADYMDWFPRQPQVFTDLGDLAAGVAATGVRSVEGSVVGDESRYDQVRYVPGWPARYLDQHVIGPLSALAVNDGFERYPTRDDAGAARAPSPEPAATAAVRFTEALVAHGVEVVGNPASGDAPAGSRELAGIDSPPLLEVVGQLLRESDNSTAEMLLKELGRLRNDPSTAGGAEEVVRLLGGAGLDLAGTVVADGSGLSLDNRTSCSLLVELLQHEQLGPPLVAGLAVAGETGTLDQRYVGTDLVGVLRAKTGSLSSVTALAGVVEDGDPPLTFAYLANVPAPGRIDPEVVARQEGLASLLMSWPRVPDLATLGPHPLVAGPENR